MQAPFRIVPVLPARVSLRGLHLGATLVTAGYETKE